MYDRLKNYGKLPERQVKHYLKELISAIEYLHRRPTPIIHRDIKPENILISENDHCKLADFGSAGILDTVRASYAGTEKRMPD